jgi:hypothetical protein
VAAGGLADRRGDVSQRCGADLPQRLLTLTSRAARMATDASVLLMITESVIPFSTLKQATIYFGPDVRPMAIRAKPDAPSGINRSGDLTVLAVRALSDLPRLLNAAVSA